MALLVSEGAIAALTEALDSPSLLDSSRAQIEKILLACERKDDDSSQAREEEEDSDDENKLVVLPSGEQYPVGVGICYHSLWCSLPVSFDGIRSKAPRCHICKYLKTYLECISASISITKISRVADIYL